MIGQLAVIEFMQRDSLGIGGITWSTIDIIIQIYIIHIQMATASQPYPHQLQQHRPTAHRTYQKVSQANLDHIAISTYLRAHHLNKTHAAFLIEANYMNNINPLLQIFDKGGEHFDGSVEEFIKMIEGKMRAENLGSKLGQDEIKVKWVKVEFYVYVWYCVMENKLNGPRLSQLKEYIKAKGDILSQIPELLAYFALPYTTNPQQHIALSKIFKKEWKQYVRTLIEELIVGDSSMMEYEWLNIIKDMIQINEQLVKNIDFDKKNSLVKDLIERVSLYKKVIDSNDLMRKNQVNGGSDQRDKKKGKNYQKSVHSVQLAVEQLKKDIISLNSTSPVYKIPESNHHPSFPKIYATITELYQSAINKQQDKQFIQSLIQKDILMLDYQQLSSGNSSHSYYKFRMEWLKIFQMMSPYYCFRRYMLERKGVIVEIVRLGLGNVGMKNEVQMESVYICLQILQKMMAQSEIFEMLNDNKQFIEMLIHLMKKKQNKGASNKWPQKIFQAALTNILNLVIHRKGRRHFSNNTIFQVLVNDLKDMEQNGYETLICSIIYLLLVQREMRLVGRGLHLKRVLLEKFKNKRDEAYEQIVQYIIERMEYDDDIEEVETDSDVQKESQYDAKYANNNEDKIEEYNEELYYPSILDASQPQGKLENLGMKDHYIGQKYSRQSQAKRII